VARRAKPTFISLFCGCGGLDEGFMTAGFECLGAFDLNASAVETYNANFPNKATVADLSGWSMTPPSAGQPDLILAGPPCQGFSTVGKRNPSDVRNHLLLKPIELALATRARAVLIENVPGALTGAQASYWTTAITTLRKAGYTAETFVVNAGAAGLPQTRKRAILVGIRSGRLPGTRPSSNSGDRAAINSVLPVPEGTANHRPSILKPESRAGKIAARIGPGQKLCNVRAGESAVHTWNIPEVFGETSVAEKELLEAILRMRRRKRQRSWGDADPVRYTEIKTLFGRSAELLVSSLIAKHYLRHVGAVAIDLTQTFNGKFRRLTMDDPTNCVLTKFCEASYFLHPLEQRAFTVREAARLQGFSDTFVFVGSERSQAAQVGNAVPPPLARHIAEWLLEVL